MKIIGFGVFQRVGKKNILLAGPYNDRGEARPVADRQRWAKTRGPKPAFILVKGVRPGRRYLDSFGKYIDIDPEGNISLAGSERHGL